jgi:hypothetical protein
MPPKWTIAITLKSHPNQPLPPGFNSKTLSLELAPAKYGDDLERHIINLNKYRPEPIKHLYNPLGQELDVSLWRDFKLDYDIILYVNTPY